MLHVHEQGYDCIVPHYYSEQKTSCGSSVCCCASGCGSHTTLDDVHVNRVKFLYHRMCIDPITRSHLQWNLSNMDTLGTKRIVLISEVSLFQGEYLYEVGTQSSVLYYVPLTPLGL